MKKIKHFLVLTATLMFIGLVGAQAQAPIITYPSGLSAEGLTQSYGQSTLTVKVAFVDDCSSATTVEVQFPEGVTYVAGTVNATGGTLGITEGDLSDLNRPQFLISGSITAGSEITFELDRQVGCTSLYAGKDEIYVYSCVNAEETDAEENSYNILSPSLSMIPPTNILSASLGDEFLRTSTITNGGFGSTDEVFFYIVYPDGALENTMSTHPITANGIAFLPSSISGDTLFYTLNGATLFGGNNTFDNSEVLTIVEMVRVVKCGTADNATRYGISWGQSAVEACETSTSIAGIVTMSNVTPNVAVSIVTTNPYDYCFTGDNKIQIIRLTNTGSGIATGVNLKVSSQIPGSYSSSIYLDTIGGWVVKDNTGTVLGNARTYASPTLFSHPEYLDGASGTTCSTPTPKIATINVLLNDYSIAPGEYIDIEVKTVSRDYSCTGGCNYVPSTYQFTAVAIQTQGTYKNQCGNATYTFPIQNLLSKPYIGDVSRSIEHNTDVNVGEEFSWRYQSTLTGLGLHNGGYLYLVLDLNGTGLSTSATSVNIYGVTYPVSTIGGQVHIGPFNAPAFVTTVTADFSIPLISDGSVCGNVELNSFIKFKYSTCAPEMERGCKSTNLTIHCPTIACPKGGATPVRFNLKRISLGLADNDNNSVADGTALADPSLIEDHHAVNGDTLKGTWNIIVHPNVEPTDPNFGENFTHVYIDTRLTGTDSGPIGGANSLDALPNAQVTIYPGGSTVGMITGIVTPTLTDGGRYAHYELGPTIRGGEFTANDSIVVEALFTVNFWSGQMYGHISGVSSTATTSAFNTKNSVYSTYAPKSTHSEAPIDGDTYTCDSWNDYSFFCSIWMNNTIGPSTNISGCVGNILTNSQSYSYGSGTPSYDFFKNEFRQFTFVDEIWMVIPTGMVYRANSLSLYVYSYPSNVTTTLPDSHVEQIGRVVKITGVKELYSKYGGTIPGRDGFCRIEATIQVDPTCEATSGTFLASANAVHVGDGIHFPTYDYSYFNSSPGVWVDGIKFQQNYANGYNVNLPQLQMSGGGSVTSPDGNANWTVVVQNLSNAVPASNGWLYIDPVNSLTDIVVKEGSTVITPNSNGFYELGDVTVSSSRNITISATTAICNTDSMRVNMGYSCGSYPTDFELQACTETVWLKVSNPQSQVQLSVLRHPGAGSPIDLCSVDSIILLMNSAQPSNLDNPYITFTLPAGVELDDVTPIMVEYPNGSGNYEPITHTSSGGLVTLNLTAHTGINTNGILGTTLADPTYSPAGGDRQAKIVIPISTSCGYTSGSAFRFRAYGSRPCGGVALGNGVITTANRLYINGATATGSASLGILFDGGTTSISCGAVATVAFTSTPVSEPSQLGDTVIYTIPTGLKYADNFVSADGAIATLETLADGTEIVKVAMPVVASGTPVNYTFDVEAMGEGCETGVISAEYKREIPALICNGVACDNSSVILATGESAEFEIQKPELEIVSATFSTPYAVGTPITYNITVNNNSLTTEAAASTYIVEFFCDEATTPFATGVFPSAVPAGGSASGSITVTPVSPCENASIVTMKIQPVTSADELQCLCSPTQYVVSTPLPVELVEFTSQVQACEVTLDWLTARETTLSHYQIERSNDNGRSYAMIADRVNAMGDNSTYKYVDVVNSNGLYIYRLVTVDMDGKKSYKPLTVNVSNCGDKSITMMPNPTDGHVRIEGLVKGQTVIIYNTLGQILYSEIVKDGNDKVSLDIHDYAPAPYFITVQDANGITIYNEKLIKR